MVFNHTGTIPDPVQTQISFLDYDPDLLAPYVSVHFRVSLLFFPKNLALCRKQAKVLDEKRPEPYERHINIDEFFRHRWLSHA